MIKPENHRNYTENSVCPVIGALVRNLREYLPKEDQELLSISRFDCLSGTKQSEFIEFRRAVMAADWIVRNYSSAWLRLAGLTLQADSLSALPEITSFTKTRLWRPHLNSVKTDAFSAKKASDSKGYDLIIATEIVYPLFTTGVSAAHAASISASKVAARGATKEAQNIACYALCIIGCEAVNECISDAEATAAIRTKIEPTIRDLQQSVISLAGRMISLRDNTSA